VKHHRHFADLARDALQALPSRFALAGLSMGGFVTLEMVRQASERVLKLALLDTQARPETFAARARRPLAIFLLRRTGSVDTVFGFLWRKLVAAHRLGHKDLKAVVRQMARLASGARLFRIPDCGHLSTLEAPEAVSQVMRAWLLTEQDGVATTAQTKEPAWPAS
jgi:pimeloyl-ACP methyl ester carboxylesterase